MKRMTPRSFIVRILLFVIAGSTRNLLHPGRKVFRLYRDCGSSPQ